MSAPVERPEYHTVATQSRADERTRGLMHGDTFAVFDLHGDLRPGGLGEQGVYFDGTRHLSELRFTLAGEEPFFLGSPARDDGDQLAVVMTNPDLLHGNQVEVALGTLQIIRKIFLFEGVCYHQLVVHNHGLEPLRIAMGLSFAADYADIFEVRGMRRARRGVDLEPLVEAQQVVLGYRGLDEVERRTVLSFTPKPSSLTSDRAKLEVYVEPSSEATLRLTIACEKIAGRTVLSMHEAEARARAEALRDRAHSARLQSSNGQVNAWISRAVSDVRVLTAELPTGPYPYAGLPWFNTPFGRDGLITALECLWLRPSLARGVLRYLASRQATELDDEEDSEPGKVLHETRAGEMAALHEMPFARYYGSVDATPLFVHLTGAYLERTGDHAFLATMWPHVEAALRWIDDHGDRDGDGFVEYARRAPTGLLNQGWKDSDDSVFHRDGALAQGPIALCEVQAYVYGARIAAARMADALGLTERAGELRASAATLQKRFEQEFWSEELSTYVAALDGRKRPCRVRTSNAGQCLFTGIASPERARRVARTLMSPDSFSGWGIRTVAASQARYNPMAYHNGSVWPHDNALIAFGLARYGLGDDVLSICRGQFEAATYWDMYRVPELFCGFAQVQGEGPVLYPVACAPQAWSAASVFMLLQACLGVSVDGVERRVSFTRPALPDFVRELRLLDLEVGDATVDLMLVRHDRGVGVEVLRREGDVQITVVK